MSEANDLLDWVERLGGWGVVLIVVRWMMQRIDALIDGMRESLLAFQSFEKEERKFHEAILVSQKRIGETLERLVRQVEPH